MKIKLVSPHKMFRAGLHYYFNLNFPLGYLNDVEHLLMQLVAICISSLEKYLF